MNKSTYFSGQPTFNQLLKFIPKEVVSKAVFAHKSDRYYKKFTTWHHLTTMLFACFGQCSSLREVVTGMRALEGRLSCSGLKHLPTRSTFSEANQKRSAEVFEDIYFYLKNHWDDCLPDSRNKAANCYIIDSTVITLFQEIFRGSGTPFADGRRKGGLKVHMAVPLNDPSPCVVHIGEGADNDLSFHKHLSLPPGSTVIMDRGYRSYPQFNLWSSLKIRWITRLWESTHYKIISEKKVNWKQRRMGVRKDLRVRIGYSQPKTQQVKARIIEYIDPVTNKHLHFLTNDFRSGALTIANLYAKRWNIELLFKRLKQNMPLNYFLGNNQNAIRIQIWCALIADFLLNLLKRFVKKQWAFSNIASLIRLHLFNYLDLIRFLENPEACKINEPHTTNQLQINLSG